MVRVGPTALKGDTQTERCTGFPGSDTPCVILVCSPVEKCGMWEPFRRERSHAMTGYPVIYRYPESGRAHAGVVDSQQQSTSRPNPSVQRLGPHVVIPPRIKYAGNTPSSNGGAFHSLGKFRCERREE